MTFIEWLQTSLNLSGANLVVDGDWGRKSIAALEKFQHTRNLPVTRVADEATVKALREVVSGQSQSGPVQETMPPWMAEMRRKMGLNEIRDNSSLISWLRAGKYLGNPKDLPWCGDAIETCITKTLPQESVPSNPFWAQNWAKFGRDVVDPIVGSIGVIRWASGSGHVTIVAGKSGDTIYGLGGNQSNSINITGFGRHNFIAFRWPLTYPIKSYPALRGSAIKATGNLASTR